METSMDSVQRFTNRADVYACYRPGYPPQLVTYLEEIEFLMPGATIADVGSGTGKLTRLFLDEGYVVWGVEPNDAMRAYAERDFAGLSRFKSVAACAEATGLPDASVDVVTAGQAFHWFDAEGSRTEFKRILRAPYRVVLVRNDRQVFDVGFTKAYDALVEQYCHEYRTILHRHHHGPTLERFFRPAGFQTAVFPHEHQLDWEALRGRLLSSSYVPRHGPVHDALFSDLQGLFEKHACDNQITFRYDAHVCYGCLG